MQQCVDELAQRVRSGKTSAAALVEESLATLAANTGLNAFISVNGEGALEAAREVDERVRSGGKVGPLCGVPLVIKDNIDVAGIQTTAGTPGIAYTPRASAPVVARLQAADAIIIGKGNLHELAFGVTTNNGAFGAVKNPKGPDRIPGGSSGGTAAAIAAGIVPAGLGTDTAGSVRLPAALTGIAGLRPTTNSVDSAGVVPSVPSFDVVGPMANSVADLALLYGTMTGEPVATRLDIAGRRFGVARPQAENLSPGVEGAMLEARQCLQAAGAILVEVDLSAIVAAAFEVGFPIGFHQMKSAMAAYLAQHQPSTSLEAVVGNIASPDVRAVYENAVLGPDAPGEGAYQGALARMETIQQDYRQLLVEQGLDALIFPTSAVEAQPRDAETVELNGEAIPIMQIYMRNNAATGVCGAPGLTLPIGCGEGGMPVGLELDGLPGADLELLGIGLGVEAALARGC